MTEKHVKNTMVVFIEIMRRILGPIRQECQWFSVTYLMDLWLPGKSSLIGDDFSTHEMPASS